MNLMEEKVQLYLDYSVMNNVVNDCKFEKHCGIVPLIAVLRNLYLIQG